MALLTPPPTWLGINDSYIFSQPSNYRMLHLGAFWTKGDFIVNTAHDEKRFLKASHRTWSSKREITDIDGNVVFKMRMNNWNLRTVYYLEQPDGTQIAELKGRWQNPTRLNADLHFTNRDGTPIVLGLRAQEKYNEQFNVMYGDQRVAMVGRHDWNKKVNKEEGACQTYDVSVAANVDTALISFVVMALEDAITTFRGASLASPGIAAAVGITSAVRGAKDKNAGPKRIDD